MKLNCMQVILFSIFFFTLLAVTVYAKVGRADCFTYYKFQDGLRFENFHTDKAVYKPGDSIIVSYTLKSYMESPIVQGSVRAQIVYNDNGVENIIDEFFVMNDVNMQIDDSLSKEFRWSIPSNAKSGSYVVKMYFIVSDKFNLAGINFLTTIPGEVTTFEIENSGDYSNVYFDQSSTYVNDELYPFIGFPESYDVGTEIKLKTDIVNEGDFKKSLNIKIATYSLDEIRASNLIVGSDREFSIELNAGESKEINYSIGNLNPDAYLIKLTASDGARTTAIMKIRTPISGVKGTFNYIGLYKFPMKKGDKNAMFFCISELADYITQFKGHGSIELSENDETIIKEDFGPLDVLPTEPQGYEINFTNPKSLYKVKIRGVFYDENNTLMDSHEVEYDITKFINIGRRIYVKTKWAYSPGSDISYTISYTDKYGNPIKQNILLYLTDPDDKMIYSKNITVNGILKGSIQPMDLQHGKYRLAAIDLTNDVKGESEFSIWFFDFDLITLLIIIIVLVGILIFIYYRKTRMGWSALYKKYR